MLVFVFNHVICLLSLNNKNNDLDFYVKLNEVITNRSHAACVTFLSLPPPPQDDSLSQDYLRKITALTDNLPPTVMVYGNMPVITTNL
jgi:hypothetical protein